LWLISDPQITPRAAVSYRTGSRASCELGIREAGRAFIDGVALLHDRARDLEPGARGQWCVPWGAGGPFLSSEPSAVPLHCGRVLPSRHITPCRYTDSTNLWGLCTLICSDLDPVPETGPGSGQIPQGGTARLERARWSSVEHHCWIGILLWLNPVTTTGESVAYSWGMVHMGRFAAAYRRTFGEIPSQTLKRSPKWGRQRRQSPLSGCALHPRPTTRRSSSRCSARRTSDAPHIPCGNRLPTLRGTASRKHAETLR
jgi:hypothetical protein